MSNKTISRSASSAAKGDDRNLVPAESSGAFAMEDKALEFGKRNQKILIAVIVVILLGVAGYQVARSMQASKEAEVRQAFGLATTIDAKRSFAAAHPGEPLAGLALLAVADDSYTNSHFADAAGEYATAAAALTDPLLKGRAEIGVGMAQLKAGNVAAAEAQLRKVAGDANELTAFRSQAYYELASYYDGEKDVAKARDAIDQLKALDNTSYWSSLAAELRSRIDAEELTATGGSASFSVPSAPTTPPAPASPPAN